MFGRKVRVRKGLYEELRRVAERRGYSSVEELIVHVLEQAAADGRAPESDAAVRERLKGLGYLE